ncbi:MAG: hypothetical protein IKK39_14540 [Thermoguttaceae bacterium]|nr:hypothetical protein [Thermoguttaceae bacterium]MBR4105263.1 hypothetical protein [Thermoguttaceae bacterium]
MSSRQKEFKKLYKKLKKRYPDDPVVLSRDRKTLEHLVFAVFLENAKRESACAAFDAMERYYIDWNEIRVSTANEIADVVEMIPDATRAGERLRRLLQWIFDETYKFDLEDLRAQGSGALLEFLKSVPFSTAFMNDYAALQAFGEGAIPLSEGAMRALRLLDFVVVSADGREIVPELDGAFEADEALDFFFSLHELGVEMLDDDKRDAAIKFLRSIDAAVDERSWQPFVEPSGPTDPREIARLVAKQDKRQKRASTPLIDEIDMLDDAIDGDDLDGDDLLTKDSDDGYAETFGAAEPRSDEDVAFGLMKKRTRKTLGREKGNGEETAFSRDGAAYSEFDSSEERELFAFEDASDFETERRDASKAKKKRRSDEETGASGDWTSVEASEESKKDAASKSKKKSRSGEDAAYSDEKTEKKEAKKVAKKSAKKEAKNEDGAEETGAETVRKPKSRAKGKTNKSDDPSDDAAN